MRSARTLWLIPCMLAGPAAQTYAEDLKTADEVIAKYVEAVGGKARLDSIHSMRLTGKTVMQGGMEMPMVLEVKRPNMFRVESQFQGMTVTQAFDGTIGWTIMPFAGKTDPEQLPPDQVKRMSSRADIHGPLVDYEKKGHKVELLGTDEVEGTAVYKIKVDRKDGDVETYFIDKEHFLPISMKTKTEVQGTEMEIETSFGDYKAVEGYTLPHSVSQKMGMFGQNTMAIDKVEINPDIPDDRFAMPQKKEEAPTEEKKEEKPEDK